MTQPGAPAPQPAPNDRPNDQGAAVRGFLHNNLDRIAGAVGKFSGHEQKAKAGARLSSLLSSPEYQKMVKRLTKSLKNLHMGPQAAAGGDGVSPEMAHHVMATEANGQETFVRDNNPMVVEYNQAKAATMSKLGSDQGWLAQLVDLDAAGRKIATYVKGEFAKFEWMRDVKTGHLITGDGDNMLAISDKVVAALGGKVFNLKDKAFLDVTFSYDAALGDAGNRAVLDQAKAQLAEIEQLAGTLKKYYHDYGAIIVGVGDHVTELVDDEGWKAYATQHLKPDNVDIAINGIDLVLTGLAASIREVPYPGVGAASSLIMAAIGTLTGMLHKRARDARITAAKRAAQGGVPNPEVARQVYIDAMDADKSLMARRVLQIQTENLETFWSIVAIGLAEIPVPLVGTTIKTFCLSATTGYYKARVDTLRKQLATTPPDEAEELLNTLVIEPAKDATKDVALAQYKTQLAELGLKIWEEAGKKREAVFEFFKEKFEAPGELVVDIAKEGAAALLADLAAALMAKLIVHISGAMAQAVSGGDLRKIIDEMQGTKDEVERLLASMS